jgi:cell division protein FtsW
MIKNRLSSQQFIISVVSILCLIGILTVASAITTRTNLTDSSFLSEFYSQMIGGFFLGIFGAYLIVRIGLQEILKHRRSIIIVSLLVILYLAIPSIISFFTKQSLETTSGYFKNLPIRPIIKNGAVRWLKFGPIQFQPVELVKLSTLIYFASYFASIKDQALNWDNCKKPFYIAVITAFCVIIQPDLGSIIIIFLMLTTALFLKKIAIKPLLITILIICILTSFTIAITPYRRDRFLAWFSNSNGTAINGDDNFLQVQKVKEAVRNGGLLGVGYTKGQVKELIPEVSSDAIIAIVFEEFGLLAVIFIILLFLSIYIFCIEKGLKIQDFASSFIIIGVGSWIFYQALWNIAGITGFVPLKGLPLPFLSEGGTSVAVNIISLGFILASLQTQKDI